MESEFDSYIDKEDEIEINNKDKNKISTLKKALSSKDQIILKLKKKLEIKQLKKNLNKEENVPKKNANTNRTLDRYESYNNIKENKKHIYNTNYNLIPKSSESNNNITELKDIQKQIADLNFELNNKKKIIK